MSDTVLFGVLNMPFDLVNASRRSVVQYCNGVAELASRVDKSNLDCVRIAELDWLLKCALMRPEVITSCVYFEVRLLMKDIENGRIEIFQT